MISSLSRRHDLVLRTCSVTTSKREFFSVHCQVHCSTSTSTTIWTSFSVNECIFFFIIYLSMLGACMNSNCDGQCVDDVRWGCSVTRTTGSRRCRFPRTVRSDRTNDGCIYTYMVRMTFFSTRSNRVLRGCANLSVAPYMDLRFPPPPTK
jgi:hypothetical protein